MLTVEQIVKVERFKNQYSRRELDFDNLDKIILNGNLPKYTLVNSWGRLIQIPINVNKD